MKPAVYKLKVCVVGDFAVGKTSLIRNFVEKEFSRDYRPTIGANLFIKEIFFKNQEKIYQVKIDIWDIAGQELWQKVRHLYFAGAQGVFVVGDLTRKKTFENIEKLWLDDIRSQLKDDIPILLIGNKTDLKNVVDESFLSQIVSKNNLIGKILTSAKTGEHVDEAFLKLTREILNLEGTIIQIPAPVDREIL